MKFPIHAWRRRSLVPADNAGAAAPTAEERGAAHGISTAPGASAADAGVKATMKDMVIEDWATMKDFMRHADWKVVCRAMVRRWLWKWYLIAAIAITLTVLITTQHDAVVKYCAPVAHTIRSWPGGWLIPLALLIIVSYPPLVGHEIIGILIGLVWGLGEGFAILAAGTFIGEILLWFSFKWCCTNAAAKFEKKNRLYWSLTQLIREKTFMFVLILRFSAIPGHIVTAVSASAGANYWSYLAAAFLTLPKQFTIVYLGEAFTRKEQKHKIISTATLLLTIVVTGIAAIYVYYQMRLVWKRRDMELPIAMTMTENGVSNPTWADVVEAEKRTEDVDGKGSIEEREYVPQLGKNDGTVHRKSWVATSPTAAGFSSFGSDSNATAAAAARGWSVPHHMTASEMREFRQEMESSQPTMSARNGAPQPTFSSSFGGSRQAPAAAGAEIDRSPSPRGSTSLDGEREPPSTASTSSTVAAAGSSAGGGRQIAEDADRFAYARGGRRPDYSRMRGDSAANLIRKDPKQQ